MTVIAGVDEAGLGPVLGPLVVSATAFDVPDRSADVSMWQLLAGAVCRQAAKRGSPVRIADSKKLYSGLRGPGGLSQLERGVLSMLAAGGQRPDSLRALLRSVAPAAPAQLGDYPWYAGCDLALPHSVGATSISLSANALAARMAKAGITLVAARSEPVFAGEFNRMVRATDNKAVTLFDVTCRLLMHIWRTFPGGPIMVHVDRQGGRARYLAPLQRVFQGCAFKVLAENETDSAYRLTGRGRAMDVRFTVDCEDRHLPVALASMLSKYVRELFMVLFNRFWASHVSGLAPTAGYYSDGRRFYAEIGPVIRRLGVDGSMVYRSR